MTLYAFKPAFVRWVRPTAGRLARLGVTANEVTVASTGLSLAIGFGVAANADTRELFLLIPVWFPLRMVLNAISSRIVRPLIWVAGLFSRRTRLRSWGISLHSKRRLKACAEKI